METSEWEISKKQQEKNKEIMGKNFLNLMNRQSIEDF